MTKGLAEKCVMGKDGEKYSSKTYVCLPAAQKLLIVKLQRTILEVFGVNLLNCGASFEKHAKMELKPLDADAPSCKDTGYKVMFDCMRF